MSLVSFEGSLHQAIEFVFGSIFICETIDLAKTIAFSELKRICVTIDGDVVDPCGALIGGYHSPNSAILSVYSELIQAKRELEKGELQIHEIQEKMRSHSDQGRPKINLKGKIENHRFRIDLLKKKDEEIPKIFEEDIEQKRLKQEELCSYLRFLQKRNEEIQSEMKELELENQKLEEKPEETMVFLRKMKEKQKGSIRNSERIIRDKRGIGSNRRRTE